jgi:membrane-associated phospholipid phosphatase
MAGSERAVAGPPGAAPALAPPWATPAAVVALLVGTLLAGLVWHATRLDPVDAWAMHWQELVRPHAGRAAAIISGSVPGATVMIMAAGAALASLAGRRDAVLLALTTAPATLAVEMVLKRLVHRQWYGDPDLLFPSGHAAVATAAAMAVVLVLRVVPAAPARVAITCLAGGFVLVSATARLVETVHSLSDVVGGITTGLVVTLGAALAITAWSRRAHLRVSSGGSSKFDDAAAPGAFQSRS